MEANGRADGVIPCQGGRFGGWTLYLRGGRPTFTYNWFGLDRYTVASQNPLPDGKATIRYEFVCEGGGSGESGVGTILVNGEKYAQGKIEHTNGNVFSVDDTADVGIDGSTPVDEASPFL